VIDSLIETPVDLPTESIMELLPFWPAMRVPLSLRAICYKSFYMGACSQEFGILACGSVYNGADFSYFAAFILIELPLTAPNLSRKPVSPLPLWLRPDVSMPLPRPPPWPIDV